jgi:K(+)-stimulated pyrophosphate-energized sodium pump
MDAVFNNIPLVGTLVGILASLYSIIMATVVKSAPAGNEKCRRSPAPSRKARLPT